MTARILCIGEALIDMVPRDLLGRTAFLPLAGGAVFNTAIAARRLGAEVAFCCGLSSDMFGEQLAQALLRDGVDISSCPRSDRPSTLAFVSLTDGQARYSFFDENTAARMIQLADLPDIAPDVGAVFLGGISLVSEPCASTIETFATRAAEAGRLIMLDPNIRPGFISDEASYRARLDRLIRRAHVVKLSVEDMVWLLGTVSPAEGAAELRDLGPRVVLVTEGADGGSAYLAGGVAQIRPPAVTVADTVGAGDTFNAGFLASLADAGLLSPEGIAGLTAATVAQHLEQAVHASCLSVTRIGADPPAREELAVFRRGLARPV
ncbi:carbohydrate kinase family protein [Haematobacter missouriensis]|uniref:Carbohydrate kinase n=1 Tax=Haematobacter missouriensis TaxID=366616 RepID=A0A212AMZ7_9RHOB|nr:carbohydrate kinase [Haematobacter missouriensis]OWJ70276.1 carbohydrate kinase [Haematobacter missouriensis]OWJ82867.1 carbohydrate kinase [Haematobacter missouriensis]